MNFIKNNYLSIIFGVGLIILSIVTYINPKNKIAYVDRTKLFQKFEMKNDLSKDFEIIERRNIKEVDSLNRKLEQITEKLKLAGQDFDKEELMEYNRLRNYIAEHTKQLELAQQERSLEITQQIWNRLNQYIDEFGKENGYDIIFGAAGEGNIMYGRDKLNISEEVLNYVNRKYNGQ